MVKSTLLTIFIITVCLPVTSSAEIVAFNENEIGFNECSLGLSYSCQNLQTAKRCQVVKECIEMAWENNTLPLDDSKVCLTCMKMVQETRDELRNGTTQELVRNALDDACNKYFHADVIVKECERQLDRYISELHAIFKSEMDSRSVCSVILFCNSEIRNKLIDDYEAIADQSGVSDPCQDCKVFAVDAIATTKNMDRNVFKQKIVSLCDKLSGKVVMKACRSGVKRSSDKLYNYVVTQMTPDKFCATATMCMNEEQLRDGESNDHLGDLNDLNDLDGPGCELCLEIVTVLKEILSQDEFKTDLFNALLHLCSWFGSHKQQCEDYLKFYFDYVYELIIHELDAPEKVCQILDICPTVEKLDDEDEMERSAFNGATVAATSSKMQSSEEETLGDSLSHSEVYQEPSNETCQHCKTFAIDLIAVTKKLGRNVLKDKLTKKCTSFHVPKFMCKMAIKNNADKIYNDITTKMTPDDFCIFTTMCGSGNEIYVKKASVDDFRCLICESIVKEFRDFLASNSTKNTIHNAFLALCSVLGPLKKQCTDIMADKYFDAIYNSIILAMDPKSVCQIIDFCNFEGFDKDGPFYDSNFEDTYKDNANNVK